MANPFAVFAKNIMMGNRLAFNRAAQEVSHKIKGSGRLLDVGSSGGEPALSVANLLKNVHVVSTDLAPENVVIGQARARFFGIENAEFLTADACDLSVFPADSFDGATALYVWMFVPDLPVACRELRRVLKPGAPLIGTVWQGPPNKIPDMFKAIGGAMNSLREEGALPPALPTDANPMLLAEQCPDGELGDALRGAGFAGVNAEEFSYSLLIPGNDPKHSCKLFIQGTPFENLLLEAGGEALLDRAAEIAADTALKIGAEQVLLKEADPQWASIDLNEEVGFPPKALRFARNTCLWVTATA